MRFLSQIRVGVYICHCGKNIAGTVNIEELKNYISHLPDVYVVRDYTYMCSSIGQKMIRDDIEKLKINRVVVAACSPTMHLETFQRVLEEAGLNRYLLEMANIREKCSWVHADTREATEKAKKIVAMAVAKARHLNPLDKIKSRAVKRVLIIGGGIAGIHAAIELSNAGFNVIIVDKAPTIGGKMLFFDKTFPTLDCAQCILAPKISAVAKDKRIQIYTNSEVVDISGSVGDFKVKILRKPRYVDVNKCVACGLCAEACPMEVDNEWWFGLGKRKAIYIPFPQAYPTAYIIDPSVCLRLKLKKDVCGLCAKACDRNAINFDMKEEILEINVGAILVSIGGEVFDPSVIKEYGYGRYKNVITGMQFEILTNVAGPTGGELICPKNGKRPKTIAFIQCVGFRNERYNEYCCRIGCMESLKHAIIAKEKLGNVDIYICSIDIRAFGKGYEEFYRRAREEGIKFIAGVPSELREEEDGSIIFDVYDATLDRIVTIKADLVVLASGYMSGEDHRKISEVLKIPRSPDGFILEKHPKLDPYSTIIPGIFVAGVAQGPKDIPDTVSQAGSAAAGIMRLLSRGEIELEPYVAKIDENLCSLCEICYYLCPYGAIEIKLSNGAKKINVKEGICAGCGICMSACPTGAISIPNWSQKSILEQVKYGLEEV